MNLNRKMKNHPPSPEVHLVNVQTIVIMFYLFLNYTQQYSICGAILSLPDIHIYTALYVSIK